MASSRILQRSLRLQHATASTRCFATSASRLTLAPPKDGSTVDLNTRQNDTAPKYREFMKTKPLNPHMTNTTSTIANEFPSVGADKPSPDLITSVDPDYVPKDAVPENTERMTGGTQAPAPGKGTNAELDVGEIEGGTFKVDPHRREGEETGTLKARLLYQSRKRGTLESDLLLSTFADAHLGSMTRSQLLAYDLFLDENDWDIYYWATQQPTPTSLETAEGGAPALTYENVRGMDASGAGRAHDEATAKADAGEKMTLARQPGQGEWAQTVGVYKAAYRPVPARWKGSEILSMLRKHVMDRSAGGITEKKAEVEGEGLAQSVKGTGGGGIAFMPPLRESYGPTDQHTKTSS